MDLQRIQDLLAKVRKTDRTVLSEPEALEVFQAAGISVARTELAKDADEAAAAAERIGFPIVLKTVSPDLPHKTEAGGVVAGLRSADEVRREVAVMDARVRSRSPNAKLEGYSIQGVAEGVETLIAVTSDPLFGPVLAFGLGGIWVEVMEDVTFRIIPVNRGDVDEMLTEVKGARLLEGFRGKPPVDRDALRETLLCLSALARDFAQEIAEVEINPLFAGQAGVLAVDGLIRLHSEHKNGANR
jgi:acyl-CoA synthetase (NDP forming)